MFLNNTQLHNLIPCMVYQPISPCPRSPSRLSHRYHHTIQTGLNRPTTQLWLISLETLKYPTCTSTITWYVIWYLGKANTSNNWLDLLYHLDQPTHHTLTHEFQEVTSKKRKKNRDKECLPVSSSTLTTMPDSLRVATRVIIDRPTSDHSPHTQISKRKRRKKQGPTFFLEHRCSLGGLWIRFHGKHSCSHKFDLYRHWSLLPPAIPFWFTTLTLSRPECWDIGALQPNIGAKTLCRS